MQQLFTFKAIAICIRKRSKREIFKIFTKDLWISQPHCFVFNKTVNKGTESLIRRKKIENEKALFLVQFSVFGLDNRRKTTSRDKATGKGILFI